MRIGKGCVPRQEYLFGAPRRMGYIEVSPGLIDAPALSNALQCFKLKMLDCAQQYHKHCFLITVEGENLPEVPDGARLPIYLLEMTDKAPRFESVRSWGSPHDEYRVMTTPYQRRYTLRSVDGMAILEDTAGEPGPISRDSRLYTQQLRRAAQAIYWVSESDDPSRIR